MQNKKTNNDVSKPEILRFLWDLFVFRLFAEYDLFKPTTFIQNFIYIDFRIILTPFYTNFSRQEHHIDVLYVSFNVKDFILYPISFFLYSPFNISKIKEFLTFKVTFKTIYCLQIFLYFF